MTQKIKIEVDVIQKAVKKIEMPDGIDHIEALKIFSGIVNNMIQSLTIKKEPAKNGTIITPSNTIVKPVLKQV